VYSYCLYPLSFKVVLRTESNRIQVLRLYHVSWLWNRWTRMIVVPQITEFPNRSSYFCRQGCRSAVTISDSKGHSMFLHSLRHEMSPPLAHRIVVRKTKHPRNFKTWCLVFRLEWRWKRWASHTRQPQSTSSKIPSSRTGMSRSTPTRRSPPLWTQRALVRHGLVPERFFCCLKRGVGGKVRTLWQHRGATEHQTVWYV
jgi:hypothetical protein